MAEAAKSYSVKLDPPERERIEKLAALKQRKPHWIMREAIRQYVEKEEASEQLRVETIASWEEFQNTGECLSHEDMVSWLETWGTENEKECPPCRQR